MDRHTSRKISVLRFLAVASVVVFHAFPFEPGTFVVAPPATGSAARFFEGFVSLALMRWALPFLGLVSGYLFFRTFTPTAAGYAAKLRSRARTLLLPFLIWSGLGVLFSIAITASPFAHVSAYWTMHSVGQALDEWLLHPVVYPLWFLQALMTCMVLSPLVYLAVKYLRGWVLVLAAVWWVTGWAPATLRLWVSPTAFPPFILGAAIALLAWKAPFGDRKDVPPWLTAALTAAWLASAALFTAWGHDLGRWQRAGLLPVVVLGVCTAWTLADLVRPRLPDRWVAAALYVAPLSFFVYVTQEPALSVLKNLTRRAGPGLPPVVAYLIPPALVICLAVAVALALRRLVPRAFAVVTGGRVPKPASDPPDSAPPEPAVQPQRAEDGAPV